jgi:Mg-chelatase subunit ChlD
MTPPFACVCAAFIAGAAFAQAPDRPGGRSEPRPQRIENEFKGPQHLAVVIDCSGQNPRAFERSVHQATRAIERLTDKDTVSIVAFDDMAALILPATSAADKAPILEKLRSLRPKGMRALFAGIAKGAEEVRRNKSEAQAKRVLLLLSGNGPGSLIGPGTADEIKALEESLRKEKIELVRPQPAHGGRRGDRPRRQDETGEGARRVE